MVGTPVRMFAIVSSEFATFDKDRTYFLMIFVIVILMKCVYQGGGGGGKRGMIH